MHSAEFRLLGPMEVRVDGRPAQLPSWAERALLAQLLLAADRMVAATTLINRLWEESSMPVDPINALQTRVSKLRRSLRAAGLPELVARDGIGYRAHVDPASVDAVAFEGRLRAAQADRAAPSAARLSAMDAALSLW